MSLRPCFLCFLSLVALALNSGCGKSETAGATSEEESLLGDILSDIDLTETGPEDDSLVASESPDHSSALATSTEDLPTDAQPQLQLNLSRGDRFPLVKTVEQTLVQNSPQYPASAQTRLDLFMELQVDDVQTDFVLMSVVYKRVAYSQELNSQMSAFDSATNTGPVPPEFVPYAGMVNNGFSFRLGLDNRIREVVGFTAFLERCVQQAPAAGRQQMLTALSKRFGNDGVAGFIDETIGLLPYYVAGSDATTVAEGDEWVRKKLLPEPTPVQMSSTCRLLSLNAATAEIGITETLTPSTATPSSGPQITQGRSTGNCVIDRKSGLPLQSTRTRYLTLAVETPTGPIQQEKQIKTTIQQNVDRSVVQSVPGVGLPVPPVANGTQRPSVSIRGIQPVSGYQSATPSASPIPTSPNAIRPAPANSASKLSSTATAVYPSAAN